MRMLQDLIASSLIAKTSPDAGESDAGRREADLFEYLHEQFVRVVRDPAHRVVRADWESAPEPEAGHAPSMDELTRQAELGPPLRDMLLPVKRVQRLMDDFDSFSPETVLDVDPAKNVLRLFAPELALGTKATLPSLTRREHHGLSLDSPMHLGTARHAEGEAENLTK